MSEVHQALRVLLTQHRQIHNAFQTAVALAEWDSRELDADKPAQAADADVAKKPKKLVLSKKQFEKVAKVSEGFDQYMKELYQRDEATLARDKQQRMDYKPGRGKGTRHEDDSEDESGGNSDESDEEEDGEMSTGKKRKSNKSDKRGKGKSKGKGKAKARDDGSNSGSEDDSSE